MIETILLRQTGCYGSNGSGKTIISNFIHDQEDEKFPLCELTWRPNKKLDALVYNEEFRERKLEKGVIEGVFTLGGILILIYF